MGAIFVLQTLIIQFGGVVFETTTLSMNALLMAMFLGFLIIPVDMIKKLIMKSLNK